ncbi:hypothetical protein RHGRI_028391 [Rhododendron griersonianum]|uniref:Uncharacterized protein n=1 Tax=Rhododendron griersonianum TaxID=479676 RepID=A0AAV6IGD8_9ERIC|nr:hypothetical protein RHGRI_028391 [Rhododendron griersonianum]
MREEIQALGQRCQCSQRPPRPPQLPLQVVPVRRLHQGREHAPRVPPLSPPVLFLTSSWKNG